MQGAFLMGTVAGAVCEPLSWLALNGAVPALTAHEVFVHPRVVQWKEDGDAGEELAFDLSLRGVTGTVVPYGPQLAALFAPVVEAIFAQTGLARPALWRLVGDTLAYTLLAQARRVGDAERGIEMARAILRDRGTKLFSKQTDFEMIRLEDDPAVGDWLRLRGGCCRVYTAKEDATAYCTTCVHRDAESRRSRFRAHLRSRAATTTGQGP
ncbi:MAG: hypothetical protein ACU0DW_08435 [Shimia sp.]